MNDPEIDCDPSNTVHRCLHLLHEGVVGPSPTFHNSGYSGY